MKKNIAAFIVTTIVVIAIIFIPYYLGIRIDNLAGVKHSDMKLIIWCCGFAAILIAVIVCVTLFILYTFIYELLYE